MVNLPIVLLDASNPAAVPQTAGWVYTTLFPPQVAVHCGGSGSTSGKPLQFLENATDIATIGQAPVSLNAVDAVPVPQTAGYVFTSAVENAAGCLGPNMLGDPFGNVITDQRHPGMVA